jgi:hypothetical protein
VAEPGSDNGASDQLKEGHILKAAVSSTSLYSAGRNNGGDTMSAAGHGRYGAARQGPEQITGKNVGLWNTAQTRE